MEPRQRYCQHSHLVWSRADLGTLIVEATNRQTLLGFGVTRPGPKGPALDLRRPHDDRLDHLIQSHRNIDIVNALGGDRARRVAYLAQNPVIYADQWGYRDTLAEMYERYRAA